MADNCRDAGIALVAHTQDMIDDWDRKPSWLVNRNMLFNKEKRIHMLELGCGCGIVGISLAQSLPYCSVMLTDLPEAMEILDANIAIAQPAKASKIMQATLDWEQELPPLITCTKYDLIIVSDCTYNADSLPALIKTLLALQTISKDVSIVVSTKVRHSSEAVFFTLMLDAGFCTTETFSISLPDTNRSQLAESLEKVDIYIFHHKASRHHLETIS